MDPDDQPWTTPRTRPSPAASTQREEQWLWCLMTLAPENGHQFNARIEFSMRALKNGVVNTIERDAIAATYRRIARVTNALIADLPLEAVRGTIAFGRPDSDQSPARLDEALTATDILDSRQPPGASAYVDPHWVLMGVHPEFWNGRIPASATSLRTFESEQATPAPARQALTAASSFGTAVHSWEKSRQSHHSPETRELAASRVLPHLADANAILDILEPELGLAQGAETDPANLPSVSALAELPPIARAVAATRARDAADRARTDYADVLGTALEELKEIHARGWTALAANALGATPSSVDEALRRYHRRTAARE